jgi:hypothetical protein
MGRRHWLLRYRPRRQTQRAVGLGSYPAVSLAKARERAGEIIAAAKRGVDLIAVEERDAELDTRPKRRHSRCVKLPMHMSKV